MFSEWNSRDIGWGHYQIMKLNFPIYKHSKTLNKPYKIKNLTHVLVLVSVIAIEQVCIVFEIFS